MSQRAVSEADVQDSTCQLITSDCNHEIRPVAIKPPAHSRSKLIQLLRKNASPNHSYTTIDQPGYASVARVCTATAASEISSEPLPIIGMLEHRGTRAGTSISPAP